MTLASAVLKSLCGGLILHLPLLAQSFLSDETALEVIFREVHRVDQIATATEQKGATAAMLRDRYKSLFGLSDTADSLFHSVAYSCLAETDPIDAKAAQVIAATKAIYRPKYGSTAQVSAVPPVPSELISLQQQKTEAIHKWLEVLEAELGRGEMALLKADLRRHVSSHSVQGKPAAAR